ncbi:MAG TPA: HAD-IIIA family hydrolase [Chloroflexota bacterium]|nr:HAD-IIIA family hydrolase [Chloroflexota bacterium]
MTRGVFLDRDGVLVKEIVRGGRAYAPTRLEDFRLVPEAPAQVNRLRAAGLVCIVFTNQPEVSSGALSRDLLDTMHAQLRESVAVEDILVCPHGAADGCDCRKPLPGMLHTGAAKWSLNLTESFVVGDRWRDIDAGRAAGCFTLLLQRSYSASDNADVTCQHLTEAVDLILARVTDA